jgi:mono/diheme cytochrome c family protein
MRPSLVRQLARTLAAAFVLASLLFAWLTSRGTLDVAPSGRGADAGREAFARHCAMCHEVEDLLTPIRASVDSRAALDDLEVFLSGHGEAPPQDDREIRNYLGARLKTK